MYKAISTDCLGFSLTFKEVARTIFELHYEGFWFNFSRDCASSAGETVELLDRHALLPAGFILPVNLRKDQATFDEDLQRLPAFGKFAREVGLTRCITAIAPGSDERDYRENFEHHRTMLRKVCELLGEQGISLGLEFVGTPERRAIRRFGFIHNLDQMLELCAAIAMPNCGLLLDSWHWLMAEQSYSDFAKIAGADQIVLVHINDAPPGKLPEEQLDAERCLPGETGVIAIDEFFRGVLSLGYEGPVVAEPFDAKLATLPFAEAANRVMDAMARVWPESNHEN